MTFRYSYISLTALLMLAVSCWQEPLPQEDSGVPICFKVSTMKAQTKGISITDETLKDATVIVLGKQGTKDITINNSSLLSIKPENSTSSNWFPNSDANWRTWVNNTSYTFQSYAYTPTNAVSGSKLTVNSPTNIIIHQPETYNYQSEASDMVDYLLAHDVLAEGSKKNIVRLIYEHAFSMVEIYVVRDETITDVQVSNITMTQFYTDAKLQALSGTAIQDKDYTVWTPYTIENTTRDGNYVMNDTSNTFSTVSDQTEDLDYDSRYGTTTGKESRPAIMRAIVVPQTLLSSANNVAGTSISVTYRVNQAIPTDTPVWTGWLTQTFPLVADGLPASWEPGYKYRYIVDIDTGVHFTATVARWIDGGNIETTILPEIKE